MIPTMGDGRQRATTDAAEREAGGDLWLQPSWRRQAPAASTGASRAVVLLVGAREALRSPLTEALVRHGVVVFATEAAEVTQAVVTRAPDLVLLADDAARDGGAGIAASLATKPMSSVIPIAVLSEETGLEARLRAFRQGVAAVVRRSASVDAIAAEVAGLLRSAPGRTEQPRGDIGEVTLDELVATLASELRSGILSVRTKGGGGETPVRIVLGGGRPISTIIDEFVRRMEPLVLAAEPLEYEFDERAGGTVALLDVDAGDDAGSGIELSGLRVLLADDDTGRADAVAQELRSHGATVVVTELVPSAQRLSRLRELDPAVLLLGEEHLQTAGYALVQAMRRDERLRWASLLVVPWRELWPEQAAVPSLAGLFAQLSALAEAERTVREWMAEERPFELRVEAIGPARLLRVLAESGRSLRVSLANPRATVEYDVVDGIVAGATAALLVEGAPRALQGAPAVSAMLMLSSGRVRVEPVEQPAVTNLMSPPDVVLAMAGAEPAPLAVSIPAPALPSEPPRVESLFTGLPRWALAVAGGIVLLGVLVLALAFFVTRGPRAASPAARAELPEGAASTRGAPASAARATGATASAPSLAPSVAPPTMRPAVDDAAKQQAEQRCRQLAAAVEGGAGIEVKSAQKAMLLGDLPAAERWYCAAAERYPQDAGAQSLLVRFYLQRRQAAAALHFAERGVVRRPGDDNLLALLGDAQAFIEEDDLARQSLARAAGIGLSDDAGVAQLERRYRSVAYAALEDKRGSEAERFFRRAAVLRPADPEPAIGLARALAVQNVREAAARWAERAVELGPHNANAHLVLGDVRQQYGDRPGAQQAWQRALELDPRHREARHRLSR